VVGGFRLYLDQNAAVLTQAFTHFHMLISDVFLLFEAILMANILQFKLQVNEPTRPATKQGLELVLRMAKKSGMSLAVIKLMEQQIADVGDDGLGEMPIHTEERVYRSHFGTE
jgi:hypothetical protein